MMLSVFSAVLGHLLTQLVAVLGLQFQFPPLESLLDGLLGVVTTGVVDHSCLSSVCYVRLRRIKNKQFLCFSAFMLIQAVAS